MRQRIHTRLGPGSIVLIHNRWQRSTGEFQTRICRAPASIHCLESVIREIRRPAQPVGILVNRPVDSVIALFEPIKLHIVVSGGAAGIAIIGIIGAAGGSLGIVTRRTIAFCYSRVVSGRGSAVDWRGDELTRTAVMWQDLLAETDRGVVCIRLTDDFYDVRSDVGEHAVTDPGLAEVFDEDPAFHVVGAQLGRRTHLVKFQRAINRRRGRSITR